MRRSGHLPLVQVQFKHFKAIRETGPLALGPLTVFIGNNGSGKSSIIEALETVQRLSGEDLDDALKPFGGYEHAHYKGEVKARPRAQGERLLGQAPLHLAFRGHTGREAYSAQTTLEERENNEVFFSKEKVTRGAMTWERDAQGRITKKQKGKTAERLANESPQDSLVGGALNDFIARWQFVRLNPDVMGRPFPMQRSGREIRLAPDGSNVAQYLWSLQQEDPGAFDCRFRDKEGIQKSFLAAYGTEAPPWDRIVLICVEQMLEAWLLTDGKAVEEHVRRPTHEPPRFTEVRHPDREPDPKSRVISYFRQAGRTYNEHVDAAPIIKSASLSKLRKSKSFKRLEDKLSQLAQPVAPRRR